MSFAEIRWLLKNECTKSALLRLEIAWREFKKSLRKSI